MPRVRAWIASSERIAPWLAGIALAAPVLAARYPPMGDLAMHEGTIAVMRHLHDATWVPPGLYEIVAPQANQLFALVALALSFVLPTDVACKCLVAAIVAATPPFLARLLGALGRSRWLSLCAGPIACGWMFRWGLVANMIGFALLLFALPAAERLARRPVAARIAAGVAYASLLFFAHESSALVFAAVVLAFAAPRAASWRGFAARAAPAFATLVLGVAQWKISAGLAGANMRAIGSDYGADPLERIAILPGAVFGGLSAARLAFVGGVWVAAVAASAWLGRRHRDARLPLIAALWTHRYAFLASGFALLYLLFPMALGGTTLLAHRFLPAACACLIVAAASRRSSLPSIALAVAAPLAMLVVELPAFAASDARYRALDRVASHIPMNTAVAQLDLTPRPSGHVAPVVAAAGRVLAERGGRMLFAMTDMPPNPLYVAAPLRWEEPTQRLAQTPYAFMPDYDLTRFSFLLERNEHPDARRLVARALEPDAELVAEDGEWSLFRSRLPVASLASPDRPLPSPPPVTLGALVSRLRTAPQAP